LAFATRSTNDIQPDLRDANDGVLVTEFVEPGLCHSKCE
jgi:hypothetical protein